MSLTTFSFHDPDDQFLDGVGEPGVGVSGHGIAQAVLPFLAHLKWALGVLHVLGKGQDGDVRGPVHTQGALWDHPNGLPGNVVLLTRISFLLASGHERRAVGHEETNPTNQFELFE